MNKVLSFFFFLIGSGGTVAQTTGKEFVTVQASTQYSQPSFFRKLVVGTNYRQEWQTPVTLPVFRLQQSGLTIKELGGGMQTRSLQLEDAKGKKWALRSVEKYIAPNLPKWLQQTFVQDVLQDMISAAHPYAPLTVPPLAKALNIGVPSPTFYYIPDDPNLGEYRTLFANTVGMLEEKAPTPDDAEAVNTTDALEKVLDKNNNRVAQKQVLRARLLDMLIADWDRHAGQWRWGKKDSGNANYYYAIPLDRDQTYFQSNGLLMKVARQVVLKHFVGFRDNLSGIKQLNFKSWKFDQTFINDLTKDEWKETIIDVQNRLTDNVIDDAVKKLPPEIYAINGSAIAHKLKSRRQELLAAALKYYDYISYRVTVNGSDEVEVFKLSGAGENVLVEVYAKNGSSLFSRLVKRKETKEIVLNGLGGNDQFIMAANVNSSMKIKINGGTGADVYDLQGKLKSTIEDFETEKNEFKNAGGVKLNLK